ncbi:MAG: hypothetical protein ACKOCD_01415, partial [Nitrospiraceae bacterium]
FQLHHPEQTVTKPPTAAPGPTPAGSGFPPVVVELAPICLRWPTVQNQKENNETTIQCSW